MWTTPAVASSGSVVFSPSGDRGLVHDLAALPDGTVFVTGHAGQKQEQEVGFGPGRTWPATAGSGGVMGPVYVLSVDLPEPGEPNGFRLRKYLP